jgi:phenylacetate-coenzyme A ligase PaaK-like adenylate-forming protein
VVKHPHVFRSPLSRRTEIIEYQVRQTDRGADIDVRLDSEVDLASLVERIQRDLEDAGLADPAVMITAVESIERSAAGKQRRFVPLA